MNRARFSDLFLAIEPFFGYEKRSSSLCKLGQYLTECCNYSLNLNFVCLFVARFCFFHQSIFNENEDTMNTSTFRKRSAGAGAGEKGGGGGVVRRNTHSHLILLKSEISAGRVGH